MQSSYGVYWNSDTFPINLGSNYAYGVQQSFEADMWWFGAYMDGSIGPVINRGNTGIATRTDYAGFAGSPYGGTWFLQAFGSYKPVPWYKATFKVFYIGDTTKNGDTFGSRRNAAGTLEDHNTSGWEFDIYNEFQIYKNLKYTLAGGYMFAGDAFSKQSIFMPAGNKLGLPTGIYNVNLKDPWIITSCLIYNF